MYTVLDTLDKTKTFIKNFKGIPAIKKMKRGEYQMMSIISDGNDKEPNVGFGVIDDVPVIGRGFDTEHAKFKSVEIDGQMRDLNYHHWVAFRTNKDKSWKIELIHIGYADRVKGQLSIVWKVGDEQPMCPECAKRGNDRMGIN